MKQIDTRTLLSLDLPTFAMVGRLFFSLKAGIPYMFQHKVTLVRNHFFMASTTVFTIPIGFLSRYLF